MVSETISFIDLLDYVGFLPSRFLFLISSLFSSILYILAEASFIEGKVMYSPTHNLLASFCSTVPFFMSLNSMSGFLLLMLGLLWSNYAGFYLWSWDFIEMFSISLFSFCSIISHFLLSIPPIFFCLALFIQNLFRSLSIESTHITSLAQNTDNLVITPRCITKFVNFVLFFYFRQGVITISFSKTDKNIMYLTSSYKSHFTLITKLPLRWKVEI